MRGDRTFHLIVCGHSYTELVAAAKRTTLWTLHHLQGRGRMDMERMEGVLGARSCLRALTQGGDPTESVAPGMPVALCIPAAPYPGRK